MRVVCDRRVYLCRRVDKRGRLEGWLGWIVCRKGEEGWWVGGWWECYEGKVVGTGKGVCMGRKGGWGFLMVWDVISLV